DSYTLSLHDALPISRAKVSFILSLISTSISVILIAASLILLLLSEELETRIKENISINIFLKESVNDEAAKKIEGELQNSAYINSTVYVDKKTAAEIFVKETGEDFRKILDY